MKRFNVIAALALFAMAGCSALSDVPDRNQNGQCLAWEVRRLGVRSGLVGRYEWCTGGRSRFDNLLTCGGLDAVPDAIFAGGAVYAVRVGCE